MSYKCQFRKCGSRQVTIFGVIYLRYMKWIYRFFVVLGVIFFCILIALAYFIIVDPLNIRPVVMSMYGANQEAVTNDVDGTYTTGEAGSDASGVNTGIMTDKQEQALQSVGISPEAVPSQFTPEQIECFVKILGQERVDDIKAGDTPTAAEFYQAKDCV